MSPTIRVYGLLFILSIITAGGSILYLSSLARESDTDVARSYPAVTSNDAFGYGQIAKNIVEQGIFSKSTEAPFVRDTWRTPGYPLFVAAFYAIFHSFYPVLIAQMFIVFLTSILVFLIAEKIIGPRWGLVAAALYIIDPNTMLSASLLLTENIFLLTFMTLLYVLFFSEIKNIYLKWMLAGLLLALATYIRPAAMLLPFVLIQSYFLFYKDALSPYRTHIVGAFLFLLVFMGALSPWYIRNHAVSGVWGFSSISAYALFDADTPYFLAATHGISVSEAKIELRKRAGLPLDQPSPFGLEDAGAMRKAALSVIMAEPFSFALYRASSMISFFVSSGVHDYWRVYVDIIGFKPLPEPSLTQALNPFSLPLFITVIENHGWNLIENALWALIVLLTGIGIWRSKNVHMTRIFVMFICYFALITGVIAHARYRIPIIPLLFIGALSATAYFWEKQQIKPPTQEVLS